MHDALDGASPLGQVAITLIERARPAVICVAGSEADVEAAQRLRGRAIMERGWAPTNDLVDGREVSDGDDRALHLLALIGDEPVGTCRLVFSEDNRPLPVEAEGDWSAEIWSAFPRPVVEMGRVVVMGGHGPSQHALTAALIGKAWLEITARGYGRICGTATVAMLRLYRRLGFVLTVIGPKALISGEDRYPVVFEPNAEATAAVIARHSIIGEG
jgi:hypothetical protein